MYSEAAQADGPPPSSRQIDMWFWSRTIWANYIVALRSMALAKRKQRTEDGWWTLLRANAVPPGLGTEDFWSPWPSDQFFRVAHKSARHVASRTAAASQNRTPPNMRRHDGAHQ